ncbi:DUF4333 domain-containing protein [Actinosynnema sp. NPDC050801]|uniref:DUF4333 domain-containing protein n=1 Tax=unclassified Actinosynnema TaxID=2637065 RepID=UPI00340E6F34
MRVPSALLVSVATLVIFGTACTATTPGTPQAAPTTVTMVSTVTVTPTPRTRRVFDTQVVELGVGSVLRDDYKFSGVKTVECPEDQPVVVGTSFVCVVQLDGRSKEVTVTVKSGDGEYEVGQPR